MAKRIFPVLCELVYRRAGVSVPANVPWEFLEPHEEWALRNHMQSLQQLAARGGLDPAEMIAIVEHRPWTSMPRDEAAARLAVLLEAFRSLHERSGI